MLPPHQALLASAVVLVAFCSSAAGPNLSFVPSQHSGNLRQPLWMTEWGGGHTSSRRAYAFAAADFAMSWEVLVLVLTRSM